MPADNLYDRIAQKIVREINTGKYPVGELLPREVDLAKAEGVSRATIRSALEKLGKHGLIKRTPHVGTRVVSRGRVSSIDEQLSTMSDLDRLAVRNPRKLLEVKEIVVDKTLSERIHCPAGEPMIRISMVREGARPSDPSIARTTEYIPPEWGRLVRISQENPDRLMIDLICSHYRRRCVEVRQTIEATALSEEVARNLDAQPGVPALRILRRYISDRNRTLLITLSIMPSDRYAFNLNVRID